MRNLINSVQRIRTKYCLEKRCYQYSVLLDTKVNISKEPVHISKLQTLRKAANEMCIKSRNKSKRTPQTTEEIAIDLLKSLGYRISKPQLLVEEAMKNPEKPVSEFIQYIRI